MYILNKKKGCYSPTVNMYIVDVRYVEQTCRFSFFITLSNRILDLPALSPIGDQ